MPKAGSYEIYGMRMWIAGIGCISTRSNRNPDANFGCDDEGIYKITYPNGKIYVG
jgi:hypothetical protein